MITFYTVLGVIIIILGLILSIYSTFISGFLGLLIGLFTTFVSASIYFTLSSVLSRLDALEGNNYIANHSSKSMDIIPKTEPDETEWKCPDCGRINKNYTGLCACGKEKQ